MCLKRKICEQHWIIIGRMKKSFGGGGTPHHFLTLFPHPALFTGFFYIWQPNWLVWKETLLLVGLLLYTSFRASVQLPDSLVSADSAAHSDFDSLPSIHQINQWLNFPIMSPTRTYIRGLLTWLFLEYPLYVINSFILQRISRLSLIRGRGLWVFS